MCGVACNIGTGLAFDCAVCNAADDLLLTEDIEDQNRDQCQQIGGKCQVVVGAELCLEVQQIGRASCRERV